MHRTNTNLYAGLILFCALFTGLTVVPANAQANDSLVVYFWQSIPGQKPGFLDDLTGFDKATQDANGDGVADVISVDTDEQGKPEAMNVLSFVIANGGGLGLLDSLWRFNDLDKFRETLTSEGISQQDANDLSFLGFVNMDEPSPVYPLLFQAGESHAIYFPRVDGVVAFQEAENKLIAADDFDGDKWIDLLSVNPIMKVVKISISSFAPGG